MCTYFYNALNWEPETVFTVFNIIEQFIVGVYLEMSESFGMLVKLWIILFPNWRTM
jgi:hypothetical protein